MGIDEVGIDKVGIDKVGRYQITSTATFPIITILSWASAYGRSQFKHQKFRLGSCTEEVLEWFNYLHASKFHVF